MFKDHRLVALEELLDIKKLGLTSARGRELTKQDLKGVVWIKNEITKLVGKDLSKVNMGFIFDKPNPITQLILIVDDELVHEVRWVADNITSVVKAWVGLEKAELHIIQKRDIIEDFKPTHKIPPVEYYLVFDKLILLSENGYKIIPYENTGECDNRKLSLQDAVNLLYKITSI